VTGTVRDPCLVRTTRALAALLGVVGAVVAVVVQPTVGDALGLASVALLYGAYTAMGLLILRAEPTHLVGRLMLCGGVIAGVGGGLLEVAWTRLRVHPHDTLAALTATIGSAGRGLGWLLVVLVLPFVFPDGRRAGPPHVALWAWRICLTTVGIFTFVALMSPQQTDTRMLHVDNPIGLPHRVAAVTDALSGLALVFALATIVLAIICLVWRWRKGSELRRQQLLWFGLAFAPPVCVLALSFTDAATPWMFALVSLPLPVAIGVACRQHKLYDVNLVVNRSLTYAALWLTIAALYALTVGGAGAMLRQRGANWLPWVAAGVVAVSFAPLRDALQRAANRLTYGQWSQPAEVLAATGRRLGDASDVTGLLQTLTDELGSGLGLTYVEITDSSGTPLAVHGTPTAALDALGLQAYGVTVGALRWSRRTLRDSDRALLSDLASQLGAVVHAAGLLQVIRTSQERLVLAREEERKRLRRDLHDGLGPALAGLTLQVDTLRNRLDRPTDEGLLGLRSGIQSTVLDVRRIVEGLRPPALDELGLSEALVQLADRLTVAGKRPAVSVHVDAAGLPAAAEVAAYRIVQEALANAVHHSGAGTVTVSVHAENDCLIVRVADDGSGRVTPRDGGVGLASMRERAEEIGGSFSLSPEPDAGTTVTARLPIASGRSR
jgi:signal transduction histidine kinase